MLPCMSLRTRFFIVLFFWTQKNFPFQQKVKINRERESTFCFAKPSFAWIFLLFLHATPPKRCLKKVETTTVLLFLTHFHLFVNKSYHNKNVYLYYGIVGPSRQYRKLFNTRPSRIPRKTEKNDKNSDFYLVKNGKYWNASLLQKFKN